MRISIDLLHLRMNKKLFTAVTAFYAQTCSWDGRQERRRRRESRRRFAIQNTDKKPETGGLKDAAGWLAVSLGQYLKPSHSVNRPASSQWCDEEEYAM